MPDQDAEIESSTFHAHFDGTDYRSVTVSVRLGDSQNLEVCEEYDPAVEDADKVIARCADDLRLLIKRRGRA